MTELREKLNEIATEKSNKIVPENIKVGVEVFDVVGNYTSDATATAGDILKDKTAYVNGEKITGTREESVSGGELETSFASLIDNTVGANCTKLPENLTLIRKNAFNSNYKICIKELPKGLTTIEESGFYNCKFITLTKLPDSLTNIGSSAFYYCENIELTELPEALTVLNSSVFNNCRKLALTKLPENLTTIGSSAFYYCEKLNITKIPDKVTSIGASAFAYCSGLTSIEVPEGVTTLSERTFQRCTNLTEVTLKGDYTKIPNYFFDMCTSLTKVIFPNLTTVPALTSMYVFDATLIQTKTGYIYVPDSLVDSFKTATNWSAYASQIKGVSELV